MLGKTFKGMTDEMLAWQTRELLAARARAATATRCTCGPSWSSRSPSTTCRRARTTPAAWRCASRASSATATDKRAEEADTIDTVRAIFAAQSVVQRIATGLIIDCTAPWYLFCPSTNMNSQALSLTSSAVFMFSRM